MAEEIPLVAPSYTISVEANMAPLAEDAPPVVESTTSTDPEQARAVDAAFAQQKECETVVGLVGLWTGTLLLHDLVTEHFHVPREEEEKPPKKKEKKR